MPWYSGCAARPTPPAPVCFFAAQSTPRSPQPCAPRGTAGILGWAMSKARASHHESRGEPGLNIWNNKGNWMENGWMLGGVYFDFLGEWSWKDLIRFIKSKQTKTFTRNNASLGTIQIRWFQIQALPFCMGTADLRKNWNQYVIYDKFTMRFIWTNTI